MIDFSMVAPLLFFFLRLLFIMKKKHFYEYKKNLKGMLWYFYSFVCVFVFDVLAFSILYQFNNYPEKDATFAKIC
jgi:predicted membrane protein